MYISIKRRFLAYALAVVVLIGAFAFKPQRADAVALTTTAAVVALVASVMTACGVTYWANTEQDAVDYLGGKLQTYLGTFTESYSSLLDWLGINSISDAFAIMNGGFLRVPTAIANKILGFITWFNQEEGVESNGTPVGDITLPNGWLVTYDANYTGVWNADITGINQVTVTFDFQKNENRAMYMGIQFYVGNGGALNIISCTYDFWNSTALGLNGFNGQWWHPVPGTGNQIPASGIDSNGYFNLLVRANSNVQTLNGEFTFELVDSATLEKEYNTVVQPSDTVLVPNDLESGQDLYIATSAPLTNVDTNDEACQLILDTVVSQDGLTSSFSNESATVPSAWTWLYDVVSGISNTLNDIYDIILGIPNAIVSGISSALSAAFVPSQAYIDTFIASLYSTFDNHFSILSYPFSLLGTFITKCATIGGSDPILTWPDIYEPFSHNLLIPTGSYNLNNALQNQTFAYAHSLYMIVVKGIISFQFVGFLYAWFCDVFHMKNSDYDNPFDIEDETDFDDLPAGTNGSEYEDWEHDG